MWFSRKVNEQDIALPSSSYPDSPRLLRRMKRSSRVLPVLLVVGSLALFLLWNPHPLAARNSLSGPARIFNSTLGFEKVFAISFPERTDKRDGLVLAASFTNFDIEFVQGVKFDDVVRKAAPPTWNFETQSKGALGCWRAHMDVLTKRQSTDANLQIIVQEKVQTALVMEDDADWDISLKEQLSEFAAGAQSLQKSPASGRTHSPYGDEWDFLWLGHCKIGPRDDQSQFYVIENDPTVPPVSKRHGIWFQEHVPEEIVSNSTRVVFNANNGGLCMYAYAITYKGARKVLSSMSLTSQDQVVDMSYRYMCRGDLGQDFRCLGVFPTLFGTHRSAGPQSRDSDLNNKSDRWHDEYTWDIPYSTVQNIPLLVGDAQTMKPQWPDEPSTVERRFADKLSLNGYTKRIDLRSMEKVKWKGINT